MPRRRDTTGTLKVRTDFQKFIARQEGDIEPENARVDELPAPSGRARRAEWVEEVAVVLGAKSFAKQLAHSSNDLYFWDKRLLPYGYIVARTYEDDPILQVVSGKYAGQILLFNHDSYYHDFENLAKLVGGGRVAPEFWRRAQPIMAKRGYTSSRPTPDQVIAVLLDDDLDGAERISSSFDEFYATVHRYCERRPKPRAATGRRRKVAFTELYLGNHGRNSTGNGVWMADLEAQIAAGDRGAYFAPGRTGLVALRPGRVPVRMPGIDGVKALAAAGTRLYMVSEPETGSGDVLAVSSDGGRRFKTIAIGYFGDLAAAADGGVWTIQGERLVHYTVSGQSRAKKVMGEDLIGIGGTGPVGRFAFTREDLCLLGHDRRSRSIELPGRVRDISDVVVTRTGAVLVVTSESGMLRSTDNGTSWRKVPDTAGRWLNCGAQLSTGVVVAGGDDLLISHDDGQTFAVVTCNFRGRIQRVAELGDELLLATSQFVYCVRVSQLARDSQPRAQGAARSSPGVRPINKTKQAAPLRPLSSYPSVIRERVWQIQPFDRTKAYSASVKPNAVRVMENGSRVVYSKRLSRELPGRFHVQNDWLVYEIYPREVERVKRLVAEQAANWGTGRQIFGVLRTP